LGCRDQVDDGGTVCEWAAAPILRNAAKQAMLDLVPLRRAWLVVSNLDGQTGLVRELLEFHLPELQTRTIRSTAIRRNC
jgi:hypothetical protein